MPSSRIKANAITEWAQEKDCAARLGEGISRAPQDSKKKLKKFKVLVAGPRFPRMTVELLAENKRKAIFYAQNRWPLGNVTVLE